MSTQYILLQLLDIQFLDQSTSFQFPHLPMESELQYYSLPQFLKHLPRKDIFVSLNTCDIFLFLPSDLCCKEQPVISSPTSQPKIKSSFVMKYFHVNYYKAKFGTKP